MELIDRDKMEKHIMESRVFNQYFKELVQSLICGEKVVDAVEVVRCKDCKYHATAKVNCKGYLICPASNMEITDDDYCSYGRRESEET